MDDVPLVEQLPHQPLQPAGLVPVPVDQPGAVGPVRAGGLHAGHQVEGHQGHGPARAAVAVDRRGRQPPGLDAQRLPDPVRAPGPAQQPGRQRSSS